MKHVTVNIATNCCTELAYEQLNI